MSEFHQWLTDLRVAFVHAWRVVWVKIAFSLIGLVVLFDWAYVFHIDDRLRPYADLVFFAELNFYLAGTFAISLFFGVLFSTSIFITTLILSKGLDDSISELRSGKKPKFNITVLYVVGCFSTFALGSASLKLWACLFLGFVIVKLENWWRGDQKSVSGGQRSDLQVIDGVSKVAAPILIPIFIYFSAALLADSVKSSHLYQVTVSGEVEFLRLIGRNALGYIYLNLDNDIVLLPSESIDRIRISYSAQNE